MTSSVDLPTPLNKELLNTLLHQHLGPTTNVQSFTIQSLTRPGENYGSTLVIVDANIQQNDQKEPKAFTLIAKLFPTVPILCTLINITETFSKEVDLYKLVLPEFKRIQVENGVSEAEALDIFPLYYGSRLSLSRDAKIPDKDAVLLLENLKSVGYRLGDRQLGLDLEHTELVMSQLARFHALSVALKMKKPKVFNETVKKAGISCKWGPAQDYESLSKWKNTAINALQSIPECREYVNKVKDFLMSEENIEAVNNMPPTEPFATYIHNDFWISNVMFSYSKESNVLAGVKFLDFQLTKYHSPIKDIIVFLYTSTAENVRDKHYDNLIKIYYASFVKCLKQLKCDVNMFSIEKLIAEFDMFAITEFSRLLLALKVFCVEENNVPDLANFSLDKLLEGSVDGHLYKRRMKELVLDFVQKGWL